MRFSKLIANTITKVNKGKGTVADVKEIVATIKSAVKTYGGAKNAFELNKDVKAGGTAGLGVCMAVMDDESLLTVIRTEHKKVVEDTCSDGQPENFSMNAELTRGIATNAKILGACHWLTTETDGNSLM